MYEGQYGEFICGHVVVNFLSQLIFIFLLFWGMVMYANEFETKEKQKLTEIKNKLQHIQRHKIRGKIYP